MSNMLFGLKRLEAANIIFFSFYLQSLANREVLQRSNQRRHDEAEERKERQTANEGGQADDNSLSATEPNESRRNNRQPKKQPKPISRKRRIYYIALIDNNFGIGNLFLTLDLSDDVIERAERKLRTFLDALEAYYAQLGIELKWVCTREFGKRGSKRKHFHLIINGTYWTVNVNKIKSLWTYGKIDAEEITQESVAAKRAELEADGNAFAKDINEMYAPQGECYIESITRVEGALAVYMAKDFDNTNRQYRMRTFTSSQNLIKPEIETEYREPQEFNKLINGYRDGGEKKVRKLIEDECKRQGLDYIVPELPFVRDQSADDPRPPYISWVCSKGVSELDCHAWDKHTPITQDINDRDIDETIEPIVK